MDETSQHKNIIIKPAISYIDFSFNETSSSWLVPLTENELALSKEMLVVLKDEPFSKLATIFIHYSLANNECEIKIPHLLKAAASSCNFEELQLTWRLTIALYKNQVGRMYLLEVDATTRIIVAMSLALCTISTCSYIQKVAFTACVMNELLYPALSGAINVQ